MRFSVLGSGSRGNSSLVRAGGPGLLIDIGFGPRNLGARLARVGAGWDSLGAVVLTHTHRDHVDAGTLSQLASRRVPLYCHEAHREALKDHADLSAAESRGLIRTYDERPWLTPCGLRIEPIEAHHDAPATFGFRIEGRLARGRCRSVGYLADTGMWTAIQADALAEADVLALEFNHDVEMQRTSGRPPFLIRRILGHRGHLSNAQGAELLRAVLSHSRPGRVRSAVLIHLSEQCNRPELAAAAARSAASQAGRRLVIHVAQAHEAAPDVRLDQPAPRRAQSPSRAAAARRPVACPTWF